MPRYYHFKNKKLSCSLGICAYNEEKNIGELLKRLLKQKLKNSEIKEIVVIASGCTDSTEKIVKSYQRKSRRIKLIREEKRNGKASAVNLFLKNAKEDIVVLESADTLPEAQTVEFLVSAFKDSKVGMVGARPIPVNSDKNLVGFAVNLLWKLHHLISLKSPKMGEMIAFRKVFNQIDTKSAVDEASIEVIVRAQGFDVKYIPKAIVYNKGPETIHDFLRQRRRIYAGHLALKKHYNFSVSTLSPWLALRLIPQAVKLTPLNIFYILGTIALEMTGRIFGFYDYLSQRRDHSIWKVVISTKSFSSELIPSR